MALLYSTNSTVPDIHIYMSWYLIISSALTFPAVPYHTCHISLHARYMVLQAACLVSRMPRALEPTVRSRNCRNSRLQAACDTLIARATGCIPL